MTTLSWIVLAITILSGLLAFKYALLAARVVPSRWRIINWLAARRD